MGSLHEACLLVTFKKKKKLTNKKKNNVHKIKKEKEKKLQPYSFDDKRIWSLRMREHMGSKVYTQLSVGVLSHIPTIYFPIHLITKKYEAPIAL